MHLVHSEGCGHLTTPHQTVVLLQLQLQWHLLLYIKWAGDIWLAGICASVGG